MLKRIKLIQGIGTFTQSRPSGIELAKVTVIYGENRYGKSTLCDILHSLAEDMPDYIMNRQSIPNDPNKPVKVDLQFSTINNNVVLSFENGQWHPKSPDCSKLYVFDQNFIHRNVITGEKLERPNSVNMTSFILGESNAALFKSLAETNDILRKNRKLLTTIEDKFIPHSIGSVQSYANSALPNETKEQLDGITNTCNKEEQETIFTIQNINKIKQRNELRAIGNQVDYIAACESINNVLQSSLQNIHQESLLTLQNHMANHVNDPATFKGWAGEGLTQIKNNCPFCGQIFHKDTQNLITAYQNAFNDEFERFNIQTKQSLNNLRQPFVLLDTHESIIQQHNANKQILELYVEPQIKSNQLLSPLIVSLEDKHKAILTSFDIILAGKQQAMDFWVPRLEQKYLTPYEPAEQIDFKGLLDIAGAYNQSIYDYWNIAEQINLIFDTYKQSINETQLNNKLTTIAQQKTEATFALKRIVLEPVCTEYRQQVVNNNQQKVSYDAYKEQLEQSQTDYLNTYFTLINQLFKQFGSGDFEIIKVPNYKGKLVIYDLRVKFKGENIPADKINTIFSESDRRALALCIFLAKIISLPIDERAKAILILDDPVTSFDNERVALILNKLDEIQRTIKQLIITTHYKSMAAKAVKKFRRCAKSVKLVKGIATCSLEEINNDELIASEHDIAFDKIKAFVEGSTNEDILTTLRPFFENEIRYRYKKQLLELGEFKSDLSVCTTALRDNNLMSFELEARVSSIRDTLNTPMHEIGSNALENTRSLAAEILELVYNGLTPN